MLKNIHLRTLLAVSFTVLLLLVIIVIISIMLSSFTNVIEEAEQRELVKLFESAKTEMESEARLASALASSVASMDDVAEMFAKQQRQRLIRTLTPVFKDMKQNYNALQFQFHTPPATSYLRLHRPEKFGDDLSSFRRTVLIANGYKRNVMGLEKGIAGLGLRGVSPVFYEGEHIGSVEFGMSFGQPFFDSFKEKYGVDIALSVKTEEGFLNFASTLGQAALNELELDQAMNKPMTMKLNFQGRPLVVYAHRINDFNGDPIGVMEIAMDRSYYIAELEGARNTAIAVGIVSLLLGLLIATLTSRMIARSLCQAVDAMNEIAEGGGDLTARLDDSGSNEISHLAHAFNSFAEKVRQLVGQVYGSASQLASAAEEMSAITEETTRGTQQQQTETNMVVTAMNQMTATVQEVAHHATLAAEAANAADHASVEGKQVVIDTMNAIESLSKEVHAASGVISQLEKDSENIGSVLDVIKGVAEQTNLLALNAAIEAARAGEQGRGFAVVADEVRTLASRTRESTQEIQQIIEMLQERAQSAVEVMNESRSKAESSVNLAARAGSSLEVITRSVSQIKDMNTQIATAAEEQSAVAEEINRNVVNINDIVNRTAEGAGQTSLASVELARLASDLQQLLNQFKV